jgi:hypothetical protein
MTFSRKLINVTFSAGPPSPSPTPTLGPQGQTVTASGGRTDASTPVVSGAFGQQVFTSSSGIGTSVMVSGLRTSAMITKAGGVQLAGLDLSIYGMTMSLMNQLATFRLIAPGLGSSLKTVTVTAGDADGGSTVFIGNIQNAYTDLTNAPDVAFRVAANGGLTEATTTVRSNSFQGSTDVAQMLKTLADNVGLGFENSGVDTKLNNPYHTGSTRDQIKQIADHAGIEWIIDDGVLAIWPMGGARDRPIVDVSPATGMIGYPAYDQQGLFISTTFNPNIYHGATINVQNALDENGGSVLPAAEGEFVVQSLNHNLESMTPHGQWVTTLIARRKGQGLA